MILRSPGGRLALVVDGDPSFRERMACALRQRSFAIDMAETCEEALTAALYRCCDIAIVEVPSPGPPTFALIHALRWSEPDLRVVLIAGYDSIEATVEAVRIAAATCISYVISTPSNACRNTRRQRMSPARRRHR